MKKHRQYRSNQGRNPRKEEQIMNVLRVAFLGLGITILTCIILN